MGGVLLPLFQKLARILFPLRRKGVIASPGEHQDRRAIGRDLQFRFKSLLDLVKLLRSKGIRAVHQRAEFAVVPRR